MRNARNMKKDGSGSSDDELEEGLEHLAVVDGESEINVLDGTALDGDLEEDGGEDSIQRVIRLATAANAILTDERAVEDGDGEEEDDEDGVEAEEELEDASASDEELDEELDEEIDEEIDEELDEDDNEEVGGTDDDDFDEENADGPKVELPLTPDASSVTSASIPSRLEQAALLRAAMQKKHPPPRGFSTVVSNTSSTRLRAALRKTTTTTLSDDSKSSGSAKSPGKSRAKFNVSKMKRALKARPSPRKDDKNAALLSDAKRMVGGDEAWWALSAKEKTVALRKARMVSLWLNQTSGGKGLNHIST